MRSKMGRMAMADNSQQSYLQQVAQMRQERRQRELMNQLESIQIDYREAVRERDEAAARGDMDEFEMRDNDCERLEADWRHLNPQRPPAADPRMVEFVKRRGPFVERHEDAAKSALKARVAEMQQAEAFVRQQQQAPPKATEPQPPTLEAAIANFPERIKRWYAARPEYFTDPEKVAQLQYTHWVARRETGEEFTDPYFDRMEVLLGFKRAAQPHGNGAQRDSIPTEPVNVSASPPPPPPRDTAPRTLAPPVRRQVPAAPVSAPPTRDAPSMVSGRP